MTAADANFQKRAGEEGRFAQQMAERVLAGAGFTIRERNRRLKHLGVTVNFICSDSKGGKWHFDVSGALSSSRAGLIRTDTMWKTLGRANVLSGAGIKRLVLITTNLPKPGSVGDTALHKAKATFFDAIEMVSPAGRERLRTYAEGRPQQSPLPGFWDPADAYGAQLRRGGTAGADLSVPLEVTGDPLGSLLGLAVSGMPHRVKIYLPSQTKDGKPIIRSERARVADRVKSILGALAGGCTSQEGKGSWVDPFTGVVDEDVEMIEAYSANPVPEEPLREIVDLILADLDQAAAALVVNQQMLHFSR
ncbi:MAG: hypothetical protein M0Z95_18930 [Actinomycetota bacterium]|nr:hypothetical protein [Actinomycetota bacterium]